MSPLIFLVQRTIVNILKGLKKKPVILALYILLAFAMVGMIVYALLGPGNFNHGDAQLFRAIAMGASILIYYFGLRQGIEKGSSMFRAADVSLVFTGPFRPNDVLLYGLLRQLGGVALAIFIAFFQIPNLKNNFPLQPYGSLILVLTVGLAALSFPIYGMLVYAFTSKSARRRRLANGVLNGLLAVLVVGFLYNLAQQRQLLPAAYATLGGQAMSWFPLVGWMGNIFSGAVEGTGPAFWISLALTLATTAGAMVALYRLNLDYYEEVLVATDYREAVLAAKREGRSMNFGTKARRSVRNGLFGWGAPALLGKNLLELRKSSFVLFFDRISLIVIVASIAFHYIMPKELTYSMIVVLAFSVYMLFLFQIQGRWPMELARPYVFLMPVRASQKLLYLTMSEHIKNAIDGITLFALTAILLVSTGQHLEHPVLLVVLCVLCYTLLGAVFTYTDVLARRLFGSVHSVPLRTVLKMFATLVLVAPGVAIAIVAAVLTHSETLAVGGFTAWAALVCAAVFPLAAGIFKNIEVSA